MPAFEKQINDPQGNPTAGPRLPVKIVDVHGRSIRTPTGHSRRAAQATNPGPAGETKPTRRLRNELT